MFLNYFHFGIILNIAINGGYIMTVVPSPIIRRKMIIKKFINAGAVSPATAKSPKEVGSFKGLGLIYSRLVSRGLLIQTENEKYYVDITKLHNRG